MTFRIGFGSAELGRIAYLKRYYYPEVYTRFVRDLPELSLFV